MVVGVAMETVVVVLVHGDESGVGDGGQVGVSARGKVFLVGVSMRRDQ